MARAHFDAGNWLAIAHVARDRIDFYDLRVAETVALIERDFAPADLPPDDLDALWASVKRNYIGCLVDHRQPECAETFFNSVTCKILHRRYFQNRFIFIKSAISTEQIDSDAPSYRSYYPLQRGLRQTLIDIVLDLGFHAPFADFRRDIVRLAARLRALLPRPLVLDANHHVQILASPFFRNRTAYIVGRIVNGSLVIPFAAAVKHDVNGKLYADALLTTPVDLALLFSPNRAYFLVDMEVPSAYVDFLRSLLPDSTAAELYTVLGLQKHGKTLFYRDFLHHLRHSGDAFAVAPGIAGLVMTVFTLPSYPYVFKVIRDNIAVSKDTDRERVRQKYVLVKHHDRAGRMTDVLEYSNVAFPRARFSPELLAELERSVPSQIEYDGDFIVIRHIYIERRLVPVNLHLARVRGEEFEHAVQEYGNAVRELASVNIFCGDLLFKNFGVTRYGRVVFYDYDEIEYLNACRFRRIPHAPPVVVEYSGDVWYPVSPQDVFPEEFATFLLTDAAIRDHFLRHHWQMLDAEWWVGVQASLVNERAPEVLSYGASASLA